MTCSNELTSTLASSRERIPSGEDDRSRLFRCSREKSLFVSFLDRVELRWNVRSTTIQQVNESSFSCAERQPRNVEWTEERTPKRQNRFWFVVWLDEKSELVIWIRRQVHLDRGHLTTKLTEVGLELARSRSVVVDQAMTLTRIDLKTKTFIRRLWNNESWRTKRSSSSRFSSLKLRFVIRLGNGEWS